MIRLVKDALSVLRMPCCEHTVLLSRQIDRELSLGESLGLWLHLRVCKGCRRFQSHLRRLRSLCAALGRELTQDQAAGMPHAVRERLISRIRAANQDR